MNNLINVKILLIMAISLVIVIDVNAEDKCTRRVVGTETIHQCYIVTGADYCCGETPYKYCCTKIDFYNEKNNVYYDADINKGAGFGSLLFIIILVGCCGGCYYFICRKKKVDGGNIVTTQNEDENTQQTETVPPPQEPTEQPFYPQQPQLGFNVDLPQQQPYQYTPMQPMPPYQAGDVTAQPPLPYPMSPPNQQTFTLPTEAVVPPYNPNFKQ